MRIIHVIESDGGSFDFLYLLAKHLPTHDHIIVCGQRAYTAYNNLAVQLGDNFPKNMQCIYWKSAQREIRVWEDTIGLYNLIKIFQNQSNFDIVHLHSSKAGFLGRLACFVLGIKKVLYTTQAVSFLRKDVSNLKNAIYKLLEKIAYYFPGEVVCCSDSEKSIMNSIGITAISIPNGIEKIAEDEDINPISRKLTIGTTGRITIQKDPVLFNSIALDFVENANVCFLWIGDGEMADSLSSPNIEITGWLSKKKLYNRLKNVDIYISTASWEGMPLAVLEAMSLGKPLVLSNCVGNIDLVEFEKNGCVFQKKSDALTFLDELCNDSEKRKKYGLKSRDIYNKNYTIDKVVISYDNLYNELTKNDSF